MNKMNRTIATIETSSDSINLVITIPKTKLSEKRTRDFIFDTIKTTDDIFYHDAFISPSINLDSTIVVGGNTYDVKYDNTNEIQITKCDNDNKDYLGDHVTKEQFSDIASGSFISLPIGSYWTINNINYRIMALDQFYGYNGINKHHVVIMPDTLYDLESYNRSNRNRGGYYSSELKNYIENTYNTIIEFIFGSNHVLSHTHDVTAGSYNTGFMLTKVVNTKAWLINSYNVDGVKYTCEPGYNWQTADKTQFPAFINDSSLKIANYNGSADGWWLGSSYSYYSGCFCYVYSSGTVSHYNASNLSGVRPAFLVY